MKYLQGGMTGDEKPPAQQAIKEENLKRLFLELHRRGEMTRVQLSRSTGLSAATVSALVDELVQLGLFYETGPAATDHIGRKPINLRIRPDSRQLPALALGRQGARLVLYDLTLRPLEALTVPFGPGGGGPDRIGALRGALERSRLFDPARAAAVCVASQGEFFQEMDECAPAGMAELERQIGVPLFLGSAPMARAYCEKKALEAAGEAVSDLIYVDASDGVGAGILCGGDLFPGEAAGAIGHVTVDALGERCACGSRGCLERYASVDAILERARRASPGLEADGPATMESVAAAYDAGDEKVIDALHDVAEKLFRGIYGAICLTGIRRVAVGGLERLGPGFLEALRAFRAEGGDRTPMRDIAIDYARSGPDGDALGIAAYFLDKVYAIIQ